MNIKSQNKEQNVDSIKEIYSKTQPKAELMTDKGSSLHLEMTDFR